MMFKFSTKTEVGKLLKLSDVLKQIKAGKESKKEAAFIERITLKNVLSPKTLNCEPDNLIKEVYVIEIAVKKQFVPQTFIKELDNNIKFHTLFYIVNDDLEFSLISYKSGAEKGKYYSTHWSAKREVGVQLASNVPELYKFIFSKFLNYPPFDDEYIENCLKRYNKIVKIDTQIKKYLSAIAHESQSKKMFEYNAKIRELKREKEILLLGDNISEN